MIKEIAARAGVSVSTVRRALKDYPDIGAATKAKVRRLAEELDYRPNALAAAMITGRTMLLGVIVPELANSFFPEVIDSLGEAAEARGYRILIAKHDGSEAKLAQALDVFIGYQVDALAFVPARYACAAALLDTLARCGRPVVIFDDAIDGDQGRQPWVGIDDAEAAHAATARLLDKGHRDIAFVGHNTDSSCAFRRCQGYRDALQAAGLAVDERRILAGAATETFGTRAAQILLSAPRPTAALCVNDLVAAGLLTALLAQGVKVPDDFSLVGFGNLAVGRLLAVPLTTIDQAPKEMGRRIFEVIAAGLSGETMPMPNVIPTRLVERRSVEHRRQ